MEKRKTISHKGMTPKLITWDFHHGILGWGAWIRAYGYGISVSNLPPLFSERNGFRKTVRLFGVKVEWLARD